LTALAAAVKETGRAAVIATIGERRAATLRHRLRGSAPPSEIKLNIGAGQWFRYGWQTVDFYVGADVNIDLRESPPLPFADGSVSLVFSSHVLEHLDDEAGAHLLSEIARVLRPTGVVRLSVPDGAAAVLAYQHGFLTFFEHGGVRCVGPDIEHRLVNYFASYRLGDYRGGPPVDAGEVAKRIGDNPAVEEFANWCRSMIPVDAEYVAHVNGFDADKLLRMMRDVGLVDAARSRYRGSTVKELRGEEFDNRPFVSLFVEAVKR
jgi:SAM-dependent methyltransferase